MKECQKNDRLNRIWNSMGVWIKGIMITFTGRMISVNLNIECRDIKVYH